MKYLLFLLLPILFFCDMSATEEVASEPCIAPLLDTLPIGLELDSQMISGAFISHSSVLGSAYTCISSANLSAVDTLVVDGFEGFNSIMIEFNAMKLTGNATVRWQMEVDSVWQTSAEYYGASTAFFDLTNDRTISNETTDVLLASYLTDGSGVTGRWFAHGLGTNISAYGNSLVYNLEFQASYGVDWNRNETADRVTAFRFYVFGALEDFSSGGIRLFGLNSCE